MLEFGSGLSTACLARYMAESAPDLPGPFLISVEEDATFCAESRKLIAELGSEELASVHHAPLVTNEVAGRSVPAYDLAATILAELQASPAGLVFIDGPGKAGGPSDAGRSCTPFSPLLPRDFRFYLDEALTDSAHESAKRWKDIPGARIQGGPSSATACSSATTGRRCEPRSGRSGGWPNPGPLAHRSTGPGDPVPRAGSAASFSSMKTT